MTIEVAILISGISMAFGIYTGISNMKRSAKKDVQDDTTQLTTVIVKLENIGNDITEMKGDMRDVKDDIKDHSTRLVRVEQQLKALNKTVFKDSQNDN